MGRLLKFWSLTQREKLCLFEAYIALCIANLSVNILPFKYICGLLRAHRYGWSRDRADDVRNEIKIVHSSLARAANILPGKSGCLSRSIAAFVMLRRHGVPAVLFLGAKFEHPSLLAHAWVHAGRGVIDHNPDNAAFIPLVRIE